MNSEHSLETIAATSVNAAEICGLRTHYFPELKKGGPGAAVVIGIDDPDQKILHAIRERQGKNSLFLLREKRCQ